MWGRKQYARNQLAVLSTLGLRRGPFPGAPALQEAHVRGGVDAQRLRRHHRVVPREREILMMISLSEGYHASSNNLLRIMIVARTGIG